MSRPKPFADVYDGENSLWEGEKVKTEDLLGKEMIIRKVAFAMGMHNTQYARIQAESEGKIIVFTTSAKLVLNQLDNIKDKLPVSTTLTRPTGKRWLILK